MLYVEEGPSRGAECEIPERGECIVGRAGRSQLVLLDEKASRQHFRVEPTRGGFLVTDLESNNGTFVNGTRIDEATRVRIGAEIVAGQSIIRVRKMSTGYLTGKTISGHRLEQHLGGGGMGEVYRATQISLGRTVAVKVLSDEFTRDRAFIERFVAEARAAGKLNHPNVVQVYDVAREGGRYLISMEYLPGGSVGQLIDDEGALEPARALEIVLQTAGALAYAEEKGIVHCDVKPDNLLLTGDGDVRLVDLGIAKRTGEAAADGEGVFGSPQYMAPEQARGERVDHRSDLYSLGATFYTLLVGKPLFDGDNPRGIMKKQAFDKPVPVRKANRAVPAALADIVDKLVEKKPADRYQSALELILQLERARDAAARSPKAQRSPRSAKAPAARSTGRHVRVRSQPRSRAGVLIGVVVVLAAAAITGLYVASHLGRGARAFERAGRLEQAGRFREAVAAYEEVLAIEGTSALGIRARQRLRAVGDRIVDGKDKERCLEEVRAAEREAASGPEGLARAVKRLRSVSRSAVGEEVAAEALKKLGEELEASAAGELDKRKRRSASLIAGHRYAEAIRHLSSFPSCFAGTQAAGGAATAAAEATERARETAATALEKVDTLTEELAARPSALEEARKILFPLVHRTGMPEIASAASAARDKIEARAKELRGRAEGRAREARVAEAEKFVRLERLFQHGYRFGEARRFARRAQTMLVKQGMAARAAEFGARVEAITRAEILFETFLRRVDEGKLRDRRVAAPGGVVGRLVGVRRDTAALVVAVPTGGERRVRWERFPPAEMLKLFRAMRPSPAERLSIAEFCLEHGMVHEARSELRYANRVMPEHRPL
ncbi:MAG: protein kinase domain-containing protein, partial [Planctomycetota bacterium]